MVLFFHVIISEFFMLLKWTRNGFMHSEWVHIVVKMHFSTFFYNRDGMKGVKSSICYIPSCKKSDASDLQYE